MKTNAAAADAAFDALLDAESREDTAAALSALRDATEGPDGLLLALFDAFPDDSRGRLRAVARAAATDAPRAAALLWHAP